MKLPLRSSKTLLAATLLFTYELRSEVVVDNSFQAALTAGGTVYAIQIDPNGNVYLAGQFSELNGAAQGNLARLSATGSIDPNFNCTADGLIRFIQLNAAGELIVGGDFGHLNGQVAPNIARLLIGGGIDDTFGPQLDFGARGCAFTSEGDLLVGGNFTTVNGTASVYVTRLDGFGNCVQGFSPSISNSMAIESGIQAVAAGANGEIYVGGNFNTSRGFETVARLNDDGSLDTGFNVAQGTMLYPSVIVPLTNGQVLVAGIANSSGEATLKRLNADGSVDTGFHAPGFTGFIDAVEIQADGKILAGGSLRRNGTSASLLRFKLDGTVDSQFSIQVDGPVHALSIQPDHKIVVGGSFTTIGGVDQAGIARLEEKSFGFHSSGTQVNGAFTTTLQAVAGFTYVVESSEDLKNWTTFATNTATTAGLEIVDSSTGSIQKFFRARLAQ
jgi:uncharacterized delta-60 repeat protein